MKKHISFSKIILIVSIGAVTGGIFMALIPSIFPKTYQVSVILEVIPEVSEGDYFNYDGFYALQTADIASSDVKKWFSSPVFVEKILENNEKKVIEQLSVRDLRKIFKAEQISNSLVEVMYEIDSIELGIQRHSSISKVMNERIEDKNLVYKVETLEPTIRLKSYTRAFWFLAGVIIGSFSSGSIILLNKYVRH